MSVKAFLLPDLGEGLTEGEIVNWLVGVGDTVEVDQPVAEVETAKAVVEVPSPFGGVVRELHAEVGAEVEVGKPLVSIDVGGEEPGSPGAPDEELQTSSLVPDPSDTVSDGGQGTVVGDPPQEGGSGNVLVGYGTAGRGSRRRRRAGGNGAAPQAAPRAPAASGPVAPVGRLEPAGSGPGHARPLAKPPVRKMAREFGIDLGTLTGSGPHGSVTREDLQAAIEAAQAPPAGVVVTTPDHEPLGSAPPNEERIAVRGVRRAISEKMTRSRQEIPEATTWVDCDATELLRLRADLNARQDKVRVSPLALVLRACVAGLRDFPMLNARLDAGPQEIVLSRSVHLGFAAQTDRGLVVPVIRDAERRSTLDLAAELNRLAAAAREGTVTPAELQGGTFTVSNYGSFGVDGGSAIINHPEAAILGLGRIHDKPWVVDGEVRVRSVVQLSIAFDHRICDGGDAAGFLRFVADCIEDPSLFLAVL